MEECQGKEGIKSPSYELLGGESGGLVMVVGSPHLSFVEVVWIMTCLEKQRDGDGRWGWDGG